jgi:hypothetical protein
MIIRVKKPGPVRAIVCIALLEELAGIGNGARDCDDGPKNDITRDRGSTAATALFGFSVQQLLFVLFLPLLLLMVAHDAVDVIASPPATMLS